VAVPRTARHGGRGAEIAWQAHYEWCRCLPINSLPIISSTSLLSAMYCSRRTFSLFRSSSVALPSWMDWYISDILSLTVCFAFKTYRSRIERRPAADRPTPFGHFRLHVLFFSNVRSVQYVAPPFPNHPKKKRQTGNYCVRLSPRLTEQWRPWLVPLSKP